MNDQKIIETLKLNEKDLDVIKKHDTSLSGLADQVDRLKAGTKYIKLNRPCVIGDGIIKIEDDEKEQLTALQNEYVKNKKVVKFVPASGAASRMFKRLESFMNSDEELSLKSTPKNNDEKYLQRFFTEIKSFAFYNNLKNVLKQSGWEIDSLLEENKLKLILQYLLTSKGLDYSNLPKALIKFHSYKNETRNALEEQVIEAIEYITDSDDKVNLHFSISPELEINFKNEIETLKTKYLSHAQLKISLSFQKKSTDTIAVDMENNLFRDDDTLLFRPGGHGALIENLNDLDYDLIHVKNIDNVQREENLGLTSEYKKLIGGMLIKYQDAIHSYLKKLESDTDSNVLTEIHEFIKNKLEYDIDQKFQSLSHTSKVDLLIIFLNRPIRVCGVVLNEGHPGGGPFWVEEKDTISKQIVEGNQIDKKDEKQKEIFDSSTHFNPVDIICGIKDYKGKKFNLLEFVDDSAVLVSKKSKDGRELKALELPGLWNGAMSNWITIFVEVPKETFTPVKEVNDLLKSYHC